MSQSGKPHVMKSGDQKAASDADRLLHVVVFDFSLVSVRVAYHSIIDAEDDIQPRSNFQKLFVPVRLQSSQGIQPLLRESAFIVVFLFSFRGEAHLPLDLWSGNHDESPRLLIGARWAREATRSAASISSRGTAREEKCRTERRVCM